MEKNFLRAEIARLESELREARARCAELIAECEQERKWHYEQSDKAHEATTALSAERTARRVLREALDEANETLTEMGWHADRGLLQRIRAALAAEPGEGPAACGCACHLAEQFRTDNPCSGCGCVPVRAPPKGHPRAAEEKP